VSHNDWLDVRRLLVMRLDNIGDVVMLSPALRSLRQGLPDAHITLMASPAGAQVAPLLPWIDDTWTYEALWQDAFGTIPFEPSREARLIDELRDGRFDGAIVFTSFSQSPFPAAYACYLAGIPLRAGESREFAGSVLTHAAPHLPDAAHQVERNLQLVQHLGIPARDHLLGLSIPVEAQERAASLLRVRGLDADRPIVAVAPGASCSARRYDASRYASAVRLIADELPMAVVLLGSVKERSLTAAVREQSGVDALDLAGETSVPEFAAIIARARLVIANNSAAVHIADALMRPTVVLYSGTDLEEQWMPRHAAAVALRRATACSPCYRFSCVYEMECLDVPPEEIVSAAIRLLGNTIKTGNASLEGLVAVDEERSPARCAGSTS
jgi:lipopolysaccharide heptosyltransferase II